MWFFTIFTFTFFIIIFLMRPAFGVPNKLSLAQVTNFLILLLGFSPWSCCWGEGVWALVAG